MKPRYRIIEDMDRQTVHAQICRQWWPFWQNLAGYTTIYLVNKETCIQWCREAIEKHKAGKPVKDPTWRVIENYPEREGGA